jgi:acylphosphatase
MSAEEDGRAVRVVIEGRVQGVGFRAWVVRRATGLGLAGWVRNRSDGAVEAALAGPAAAVEAMLADCRKGPPAAEVSRLSSEATGWPVGNGFEQRPTA